MQEKDKINVLLIPELFPTYEGDMIGIFFLDFIKSIEKYTNVSVLYLRVKGNKGLHISEKPGYKLYEYSLFSKSYFRLLKPIFYLFLFYKGRQLSKKISNINIVNSLTFGAVFGGTLGLLIARKNNIPLVITENLGPFSVVSEKKILRFLAKKIIEKADVLTVVSEQLKSEITTACIYPRKTVIVNNPVNTDLFVLNEIKNPDSFKNFIFVGIMDENKGALRAIKAFNKIYKKYSGWTFTLVGDGIEMKNLKNFIDQNPDLSERIFLVGKKTKPEIAELLQKADFFVLPSIFESFGIAIAEAMASGLPVISGNQTGAKEFVDGECGLLVDTNSIEEIAVSIEFMINNHKSYDPVIIRQKVTSLFGFEKFGERILQIYNSLS